MLIFQFNPNDIRNVRLLDHEIPNYVTEVINKYNKESNKYPSKLISYEFIAQEFIILYIRRAIKQGHISHDDVIVLCTTSNRICQLHFDSNAKFIGVIPKELNNWTNILAQLF